MLNINSGNFSGCILGIKNEGEGLLLVINQKVAGFFDTNIALYVSATIKDSFIEKFDPKEGDTLFVIGGVMYEKNDIVRIRISELSQVMKLSDVASSFNSLAISGTIVKAEEVKEGKIFAITQEVCQQMYSIFDIFVPTKLMREVSLIKLKVGDLIYVNAGTIYNKDGNIRIRIAQASQIQKVDEEFFLGEEEAREKFI